jgi:hypothetical protein
MIIFAGQSFNLNRAKIRQLMHESEEDEEQTNGWREFMINPDYGVKVLRAMELLEEDKGDTKESTKFIV